jgi:hypothetical protein
VSDLAEGGIVEGLASELLATRKQLEIVLRNVSERVTIVATDGASCTRTTPQRASSESTPRKS